MSTFKLVEGAGLAMDLMVNGTATVRSSRGAQRYYEGVMQHLDWPGKVEVTQIARWSKLERIQELMVRGRSDAIFWSPCHRGPLFAHNHVVTVLDCINIEYIYRYDWRLPLLRAVFGTMLNNATAVVTISYATRDALLRNFNLDAGKVVVITGPVDFSDKSASTKPLALCTKSSEVNYVLMITNKLPHKNTALAGSAFAASSAARRGIQLRIVGSMEPSGLEACKASGVTVELYQEVDDDALNRLLDGCLFLFAPSLEEGLNLPVAEALSRGINVLCSDIPVHREFYEGAALFFDPLSQQAMRDALNNVFARSSQWGLPGRASPHRSFIDVANDYRVLFEHVAGNTFSEYKPSM